MYRGAAVVGGLPWDVAARPLTLFRRRRAPRKTLQTHEESQNRPREEQRIDPVVETAVAGQERPGILHARAPLPEGLDEIAQLPRRRRERARERSAAGPELRKDPPGSRSSSEQRRADQSSDRPFPGLVRRDARREL